MQAWKITPFQFLTMLVVTVVALAFMLGLRELGEDLERAQMEATVRNINSGLQQQVAHLVASGQEARLTELAGTNPVPWLEAPPPGYRGEAESLPADMATGTWLFLRDSGELVYRPAARRRLEIDGPPGLLRWRIQRATMPRRLLLTGGLALAPTVEYRWN